MGDQDRSGRSSLREINDVVQEYGQVTRTSPHLSKGAAPSPETNIEVGLQDVRRSVRQRAQVIPFQAGQGGMESKLDTRG